MFKLSGNALPRMSLLLATFSLAACGGGGGGGGSSSDGEDNLTPETPTVKPGFFMTRITDASGDVSQAATLLSSSGKYLSIVSAADGTFGTLTFPGDGTFSGTGENLFFIDETETWDSVVGSLDEGKVVSPGELTATFTADPDVSSDIRFVRADEFSDLGVTMEDLDGTYFSSARGIDTEVNVSPDGSVTGSESTGCVINGNINTINIPDSSYNVFEVADLTLDNCGNIDGGASGTQRDGTYHGLGTYDPEIGELVIAGSNGEVVVYFVGVK